MRTLYYQGLSLGNAEQSALLGDVLQLLGSPPPLVFFLHPLELSRLHLPVEDVALLAILAVEGARVDADDAEHVVVVVALGFALPLRRGEPPRCHGSDRRERQRESGRLLFHLECSTVPFRISICVLAFQFTN